MTCAGMSLMIECSDAGTEQTMPHALRAFAALLILVICEGCAHRPHHAWGLAEQLDRGELTPETASRYAEEALASRHEKGAHGTHRVAWGHFLDRAHAQGALSDEQRERYFREAVVVHWSGSTVETQRDPAGMLFVFAPAVGPMSKFDFEADIEHAEVDGTTAPVVHREERVYYHHVPNAAPRDTFVSIALPSASAGSVLRVRWRVRIFSVDTDEPLAADWVQEAEIPLSDKPYFFGGRSRGSPPWNWEPREADSPLTARPDVRSAPESLMAVR
jgi:hypothetical protein